MGSLLRRSLLLSINNFKNNKKIWISKRLQQTNATINSTNETQHQSSNNVTPIFRNAIKYGDKIALKDLQGDYTYRGLYLSSRQFSLELSSMLSGYEQERISFLMPNDASYVIVQWACWMSGHIAVPLNTSSPQLLLDYYINDSDSKLIITTRENLPIIEPLLKNTKRKLIVFDDTLRLLAQQPDNKVTNNKLKFQLPPSTTTTTTTKTLINNNKKFIDTQYDNSYYNDKIAMFVYTSGTTGKPKGVVMTFKNVESQINSLINAWKWNDKDIILHTLPLNHIHGIINVLMCPLSVGAKCILLPKFQTSSVWSYLLAINMQNTDRCNIFMAVPTIYMKLIHEYEQLFSKNNKIKDYVYNVCSTKMRLMVSGSAPLPKPIFDRWEEITGHRLLERYGMTETGMVLSNPLEGQRIPGTHGTPLPGVEVRITKNNKNKDSDVLVQGNWQSSRILTNEKGVLSGELQVKGDNVFREYWKKPNETKKEFTKDGWFRTGDTVQYDNRIYSILGRSSVDIIKTGGFKVSALQVETAILGHPDIIDCAVVGLPDITWGQKVAAVVVAREGTEIILSQLREFGKKLLPEYAVPTVLKVVDKIPKNNMGKVNKPNLLAEVFPKNQI